MFKVKEIFNKINHKIQLHGEKKAFKLARNQARIGNKTAFYVLGEMHEKGSLVLKQDFAAAYTGYYIADKKGEKDAKAALNAISEKMSTEQLERAKNMIGGLDESMLKPTPSMIEKIKTIKNRCR